MSLTRQLWLLLVITVLVALLGSVVVTVSAARGYLETELRVKNSDNAQALALSLSRLGLKVGLLDADIYGPSLPRLLAITSPHSTRSIHLLEKIGLRFERMIIPPGEANEIRLYTSDR
jgi:hypothetical protein